MYRVSSAIFALLFAFFVTSCILYFLGNFCTVKFPQNYHFFEPIFNTQFCARGGVWSDWSWLKNGMLPDTSRASKGMKGWEFYYHYAPKQFDAFVGRMSPIIKYAPVYFVGLFVIGLFVAMGFVRFVLFSASNKTIHGKDGSKNLHGNANWATTRDVKYAGLLEKCNGGAVVGGFNGQQLIDKEGLHNLIFAPTGSGKGVGIVTPTLLQWDQSVICLDIKRELYNQTAGYRSGFSRILPFDPTSEHSVRFNPLSEIRVGTKYAIADCQRLANVFINPGATTGNNKFFANEAYTWVVAIFLHVVYKAHIEKVEKNKMPSMYDVYLFMNNRDNNNSDDNDVIFSPETADVEGEDDPFRDLCLKMINFEHGDEFVNNAVSARANQMMEMESKGRSSIISSANEPFNLLFMDPMIVKNTSVSDFSISDLMNGDKPTTLYLMFPPSDIQRLDSLFRVLIELFLAQTLGDLDFVDGRAQSKNKYKLLLLMDEFTSIGKLVSYEKGLAYMRGYGVKSMVIIQNVGQLNKSDMYTKENAFLSNSDILSTYYSNDPETQQMISKMCGKTTIVQEKVSVTIDGNRKTKTISKNEVAVDLLQPYAVGELKKTAKVRTFWNSKGKMQAGENIVFVGGCSPIIGKAYLYFKDKELVRRTQLPLPDLIRDGKIIPYKTKTVVGDNISYSRDKVLTAEIKTVTDTVETT